MCDQAIRASSLIALSYSLLTLLLQELDHKMEAAAADAVKVALAQTREMKRRQQAVERQFVGAGTAEVAVEVAKEKRTERYVTWSLLCSACVYLSSPPNPRAHLPMLIPTNALSPGRSFGMVGSTSTIPTLQSWSDDVAMPRSVRVEGNCRRVPASALQALLGCLTTNGTHVGALFHPR